MMLRVRLALIANPKSGAKRTREDLERLLGDAETEAFGLDEAQKAADSGADRIVVAGGDGSIGVGFSASVRAGVPLAVVPTGTANDFARAMGLPTDLQAAADLAAGRSEGRERTVYGGRLGDRTFVNVASIGLGSSAAKRAEPLKSQIGPAAYPFGAALAAVFERPVTAHVWVDGEERYDGKVWQVLVSASGAFGGGSRLQESDAATAEMEVYVVPTASRLTLGLRAIGMRLGVLGSQRGVDLHVGTTIEIRTDDEATWNIDGELVDLGTAEVDAVGPGRVIVPA